MNNQLKTIVLLGGLSAILIGIGGAIGQGGLIVCSVLAVAMNFGAYFFSDKMVLRAHRAQIVTEREAPELHRMVKELADRAGIPMPKVAVMPSDQPNAFATGRNPAHGLVAVTDGIMRILSPRELRGVIAHELAHIKNRDILVATIAAAAASVISSASNLFLWFGAGSQNNEEEGSGAGNLAMLILAPIAATLVQLGISRSREYLADETGARICGDPEALASALQKIERYARGIPMDATPATASLFIINPLRGQSLAGLFSTHPQTAERIRRLMLLSSSTPAFAFAGR